MEKNIFNEINRSRIENGILSLDEILHLVDKGNTIFDPFSTLISANIVIGSGNIFYPGSVLLATNGGSINLGNANTFTNGAFFLADKGSISIGNHNYFGDGPIIVKANVENSNITIRSNCRLVIGAQVFGVTFIGDGCQIIGNIIVQNCSLAGGEPHSYADPDLRGAVLKGFGIAKGLKLEKGNVVNGEGTFEIGNRKMQSFFHKK